MKQLIHIAITSIFAPCHCMAWQDLATPLVELRFGTIQGAFNSDLQAASFKGIPFAAPPARFERAKPWTSKYAQGHLDATNFPIRGICPQNAMLPYNSTTMSENCLYMNIHMPWTASVKSTNGSQLPVMLWIHGGSLTMGTAMDPQMDGSMLASKFKVIVAMPNYRLNVFGFTATSQRSGIVANMGLTDQQEALRWIRRNIASFGGDPDQVTIFGESAGGQSVHYHMVMPQSAGLFSRGISESGDVAVIDSLQLSLKHTDVGAVALGCSGRDDIDCLRKVDVEKLMQQFPDSNRAWAVYGDDVLPAPPLKLVAEGRAHNVPFIAGTNRDEAYLQLMNVESGVSASVVQCAMKKTMSDKEIHNFLDIYPLADDPQEELANLVQAVTDLLFRRPNADILQALSVRNPNVWSYNFVKVATCPSIPGLPGAYHSSEIPFVFQLVDAYAKSQSCVASAEDLQASDHMGHLWTAFAGWKGSWDQFVKEMAWPRFLDENGTTQTLRINASLSIDMDWRAQQINGLRAMWPQWHTVENAPVWPYVDECKNESSSFATANVRVVV